MPASRSDRLTFTDRGLALSNDQALPIAVENRANARGRDASSTLIVDMGWLQGLGVVIVLLFATLMLTMGPPRPRV